MGERGTLAIKEPEMTDQELIEFSREFRNGILDARESELMCYMISAPLQGLLRFVGVDAKLMSGDGEGGNHVWLELPDGRVLDPTADQFDAELPPIYLGPPLTIHPQ